MDDLDNKSLRQLAGLKKIINECDEPMGPASGAKIPASLNLTADSGPELSGMLRDIMSLAGLHKVEPDHMPAVDSNMLDAKVSTSPTMASLIGRMDDIDDLEVEVKEVSPPMWSNSPKEMHGELPSGDMGKPAVTSRANELVKTATEESMPDDLMQEYRRYTSETNNPVSPMTDQQITDLDDVLKGLDPETVNQIVTSPDWKKASDMFKARHNKNPQGQQPLADDFDAEKPFNPLPKAGIEVVQKTGGGTYSDGAANFSVSPDGKKINVVASPKTSVAAGPQPKVQIDPSQSQAGQKVQIDPSQSQAGEKVQIDPSKRQAGQKVQIDPMAGRTNETSQDDEHDIVDHYSKLDNSALQAVLRNQDHQDRDSRRSSAAISRELARRGQTQESRQFQRIISQISAKYDVDSNILEAALPSIVARLTEAKKKPSAGMTKKEKSEVVKKAKKGEDIGKPGKNFKKVEAAAKKGGAKDPKAVAAAAMWKNQAKKK